VVKNLPASAADIGDTGSSLGWKAGTGNNLALMGSTPYWNKGRHEWGFALKKPAVARSFQY